MGARQRTVTHAHIQRPSAIFDQRQRLMAHAQQRPVLPAHHWGPSAMFAQQHQCDSWPMRRPIVPAHHQMGTLERLVSHVCVYSETLRANGPCSSVARSACTTSKGRHSRGLWSMDVGGPRKCLHAHAPYSFELFSEISSHPAVFFFLVLLLIVRIWDL
jgi:hypothetical protein